MRSHFRLPFLEMARKTMETIESYEVMLLRARLYGELKFLSNYQAKILLRLHDEFQPGRTTQICVGNLRRCENKFDTHAHVPFPARAKIPFRLIAWTSCGFFSPG